MTRMKCGLLMQARQPDQRPAGMFTIPRRIGMKRKPVARNASGSPTSQKNQRQRPAQAQARATPAPAWVESPPRGDADHAAVAGGQAAWRRGEGPDRPRRSCAQRPGHQPPHGIFERLAAKRARAPDKQRARRNATAAKPKICSRRSAATAPSGPSKLATSRRLALLRLASSAE